MPEIHKLISLETHSLEGEMVQTVNARSLHVFLKSGKDFSSWIKNRIQQYEFMENKDYIVFTHSGENPSGGRPMKEYAISIEMAKEISMVERNEKGKEARQYFIQCEKRAKALPTQPIQILNDPAELRRLLLTYTDKVRALEKRLNEILS